MISIASLFARGRARPAQKVRWKELLQSGTVGIAAAVPFSGPPKNFLKWFDSEVVKRIEINGSRTFAFHQHQVEGDREAFETLNYSGLGGQQFTDIGSISLRGRNVGGLLNFQSSIVNNRFGDPQDERSSIDYDKKPFSISVGDIRGSLLNTNRFASFSKFLTGAQAKYTSGNLEIKGVISQSRGSAKTISLQGNNSAGPYYLQSSQIVRGSEEVQVDGQPMQLGRDYVISYEGGAITFVGRIIPPTSTIVVSYEALGFNSGFGTVSGVGLSYNFGKYGKIGLTRMSQSTGSGDALSTRVELFQGAGAPSTPYFLLFEPLLSRPIIVKLDGIPQILGVDYRFDENNPTIFYFLRFIPFTSTIEVAYTPKPTSTVTGDREVLGWDYRLPLGKDGFVAYYQATGEQKSEVSPLKGTARGVDARYKLGNWEFRAGARSVPAGYVSVETRGLNRNEDAYDWGATFRGTKLEVDFGHRNSIVSLRSVDADGNILFRNARTSTMSAVAKYRPEVGTTWDLEHTRSASRNLGVDTKLNRTALTTGRTIGRLIMRGGMEFQDGRGPVMDLTGTSTTIQNVNLKTYFLDASYTAGEAWYFRARTGFSDIHTTAKDGQGMDHAFSINYTPSERLALSSSYTISDSGALATIGQFDTGAGLGYGGNGFSGGASGTSFLNGASDAKRLSLTGRYIFSERASMIASIEDLRAAGAISSNSETRAYALGFEWQIPGGHNMGFNVSQSSTRFVGGQAPIDATTLNFNAAGPLGSRLTYSLGTSMFISGGNNQFSQDSLYLDASLAYRLAPRQRLVLAFDTGRSQGYLPQDELKYGLSYMYEIFRGVNLVGSYRVRDVRNRNGLDTAGAYRSRGFDIELTFNFAP